MKMNIFSPHLSRRDLLKALGLTAGAVIAGPTLAACTPTVAPGGNAAPAAEAGGPVQMELWTFVNTHALVSIDGRGLQEGGQPRF